VARVWTEAQKAALSAKFKGRRNPWNTARNRHYLKGVPLSEEHRKRVARALRRVRHTTHPVWNKGLTKETSPSLMRMAETLSNNTKGVPRPHISDKQGARRFWFYGKGFKLKMRSRWEVAYAAFLDSKGIQWLYEAFTFVMDRFSYTPDFYLPKQKKFQEIKGYLSPNAKEKHDKLVLHFGCELEVLGQAELCVLGVLTAKGKVVMPSCSLKRK
jgi:hypothetical protein